MEDDLTLCDMTLRGYIGSFMTHDPSSDYSISLMILEPCMFTMMSLDIDSPQALSQTQWTVAFFATATRRSRSTLRAS